MRKAFITLHNPSTNKQLILPHKRLAYGSRITLTSPDPSAVSTHKRSKRDTVESDTHEVTFIPQDDAASDGENEVTNERKISDEL